MPNPLSRRRPRVSTALGRLVAAALLLAVPALAPVAAHADATSPRPAAPGGRIGIGLAEIPASRIDDPRARVYIDDHVNPGTTFHRRLKVYNISAKPRHITLYAGGAAIKDHRFTFAPPSTGNELASWITLDRTELDLPPYRNALVRATVAVPSYATEGERYAVIWARVATGKPDRRANVALVNQVGIRAYLHVGPGGEPPTDFAIGDVRPETTADGRRRVVAAVTNTGHRAIDPQGELSLLEGPSSLNAGPFPTTRGTTLAPGERGQVAVPLGAHLPDGPWKYRLTLQSGRVTRTVTGVLRLGPGPAPPARSAVFWHPLALLLLVPAGLAGVALLWLFPGLRRRLRIRGTAP
ncbi:hypothetical protein Ssi03_29450 [Sphaerisporangium siamense]|uniref:DUF916 domain-containing protein n=1 Tax=Sphaerisporangium siamense TaxID=795645 RepID=A0A7W7GDB1_9ACTN|nr:peptidase [Sphaerisporangium siamense]MBB4704364.1 hypothetical protein [Sphaerisporangium siamense]GII84955.1 hypothetical protein Ssi03_29450 [Sphaerisporangium siamense]